jgi:hypothetical protein
MEPNTKTTNPMRYPREASRLLVILLLLATVTLLGGLGLLSPDTAEATATKWRGNGEINVLLRVETDDERGHVDDLLANADVALADENTGVVDRLGEAELVDAGLEASLQEVLNLEGQHVIELHARLVEHADANETANEGIAFEETARVLLVEGEKLTVLEHPLEATMPGTIYCGNSRFGGKDLPGSTTDLGQSKLDSPDLTLVAEAVLADKLQLRVPVLSAIVSLLHFDLNRDKLMFQWPVILTIEQPRRAGEVHERSWSTIG